MQSNATRHERSSTSEVHLVLRPVREHAARPGIQVDQWFSRDEAEAAIARQAYDLVVLDIELGRERHAGVAIINAINKQRRGTPVLVVSAMPATLYRGIMKALDAWDYLQKTAFEEADFVTTTRSKTR